MSVIDCNKEQTEKILKKYFSKEPKIVEVSQDIEDEIYFIAPEQFPVIYVLFVNSVERLCL